MALNRSLWTLGAILPINITFVHGYDASQIRPTGSTALGASVFFVGARWTKRRVLVSFLGQSAGRADTIRHTLGTRDGWSS